ncbi:MAG: alcohol dehydrogenase catalytic domain-containing protein [Rhodospirillales bacterium]
MRAIVCKALSGIGDLVLEEVASPPLPEGGVRIAVEAAGLNFADTLIVAGKYQIRLAPPFSPGFEVAGRVLECAAGVSRCRPGDRVMVVIEYGGFAEESWRRRTASSCWASMSTRWLPPAFPSPTAPPTWA